MKISIISHVRMDQNVHIVAAAIVMMKTAELMETIQYVKGESNANYRVMVGHVGC